jgi:hypothetical protein
LFQLVEAVEHVVAASAHAGVPSAREERVYAFRCWVQDALAVRR